MIDMHDSFKINGSLFVVDAITQYENAAVVRFHSATDIYSVYEWTMEAVMRAMDDN
jgi:hypothetical protein